eukprot:7744-Eustigmatos_ZCMA.PRE.1
MIPSTVREPYGGSLSSTLCICTQVTCPLGPMPSPSVDSMGGVCERGPDALKSLSKNSVSPDT